MSNREAFEECAKARNGGVAIDFTKEGDLYNSAELQCLFEFWQSAGQHYKAEIEKLNKCLVDIETAVDSTVWGCDGDCGVGRKIDRLIEALKAASNG